MVLGGTLFLMSEVPLYRLSVSIPDVLPTGIPIGLEPPRDTPILTLRFQMLLPESVLDKCVDHYLLKVRKRITISVHVSGQ